MERLLKWMVNSDQRDYVIKEVNEPLAKAFIAMGEIVTRTRGYPEPTREGVGKVVHPNSLILLDIRDEFLECWDMRRSPALFKALWKIVIVKYEHSPNWRNMLDWAIMKIQESNWKPFNYNRQMTTWRGGK